MTSKPLCTICHERPVYARERCARCYTYLWATGRERDPEVVRKPNMRPCSNCQGFSRQLTWGRCSTCYWYFKRVGQERPERLFHGDRKRGRHHAPCVNCGHTGEAYLRQNRCSACARHLRRYGVDRPPGGLKNGERFYTKMIREGFDPRDVFAAMLVGKLHQNPLLLPTVFAFLPYLVRSPHETSDQRPPAER